MAYVSGKDGAHPQELGPNRASERMPDLKLSFLLGCMIDLHQFRIAKLNVGFSLFDFRGAATIVLHCICPVIGAWLQTEARFLGEHRLA